MRGASRRLCRDRVRPGHFQCRLQVCGRGFGEGQRRPALLAPGVRHRREDLRRQHAFEFLLVGREFQIGGLPVGSEGRVDALHLERGAIEMRRLGRAFERHRDAA
jgi:hypothetical protein